LVVGLGNPGPEYEGTRHNIGFVVVGRLAERWDCSLRRKWRFTAEVGEATRPTGKVGLARPQTFMNRSGAAVAGLLRWLKLSPSELLVVVDDADLPLGQIRLRLAGGSGGHNGLRSVIAALGGVEEFARLRVGIGRRGPVGADITGHVLGKFAAVERAAVEEAVTLAADAVVVCVEEGLTVAMNRFNRKKAIAEDGSKGDGN
jgi:PTH1 family peptidyl-tRNA hydrolase